MAPVKDYCCRITGTQLKLTANVLLFHFTGVNMKVKHTHTGCCNYLISVRNLVVALRYSNILGLYTGPDSANETHACASVLVYFLLEPPFSPQVVFQPAR